MNTTELNTAELQKSMQRGFNTFYNNSVLTHALLPQGIGISLGFKYFNSGQVIREALIGRFGERDEKIHPGPRSYDGTYTELNISCSGHVTRVESAVIDDNLYLLVTPIKNLKKPPALLVSCSVLWNRPGYAQQNGDTLTAVTPHRTLDVFVSAPPVRQLNTGIAGPYLAVDLGESVAVSTGKRITAAELKPLMENQRKKVLDECKKYGDLAECYNAMRTCIAWDTIYEPENDQVCTPVSRLWNIDWGGYVLFDWDTYFAALLSLPENKELTYANAIAITNEITESGFIPNAGAADDFKSRDRSEPLIGSFTLREIYRRYREKWIVELLFDKLLSWNRWYGNHRGLKNGTLCLGSDPYTDTADRYWAIHSIGDIQGARYESGLDNSPMYDDIPFDESTHLMRLADVGQTGLYILDCGCLAELAHVIGRAEEKELRDRAELSKNGLEELWDEKFGLYLNKRTDTGEFSYRISPTNFYALFSDRIKPERAQIIMQKHFFNADEFFGEYIIPSIARNDPAYKDQEYWRGRIWAPMNYLAYTAFRMRGLDRACKTLAEKSRNLLLKEWLDKGHVHENYNADTGEGCDARNSDKFYHWGALLALIALADAGYVEAPVSSASPRGRMDMTNTGLGPEPV
jgi:hypothetical protein